jgi:hypothetical protein
VGRSNLPSKVVYDATDAKMKLHAPSKAWFIALLIITVIAVLGALSPIPYITTYGILLAIGSLA